jgi:hypothetical protein
MHTIRSSRGPLRDFFLTQSSRQEADTSNPTEFFSGEIEDTFIKMGRNATFPEV